MQHPPLDAVEANVAAGLVTRTGVSGAEAHLGAAIGSLGEDEIVVLASDPDDMVRVSTPRAITAVRL